MFNHLANEKKKNESDFGISKNGLQLYFTDADLGMTLRNTRQFHNCLSSNGKHIADESSYLIEYPRISVHYVVRQNIFSTFP